MESNRRDSDVPCVDGVAGVEPGVIGPYRLGHDFLGSNAAHTVPACHARTAILAERNL